jgi:hypothetical protein
MDQDKTIIGMPKDFPDAFMERAVAVAQRDHLGV